MARRWARAGVQACRWTRTRPRLAELPVRRALPSAAGTDPGPARQARTTLRSIDPNARTRRRRLDATSMAPARWRPPPPCSSPPRPLSAVAASSARTGPSTCFARRPSPATTAASSTTSPASSSPAAAEPSGPSRPCRTSRARSSVVATGRSSDSSARPIRCPADVLTCSPTSAGRCAARPRSCSRRRSTRSTSRSSAVAATRLGCGPRTTASACRPIRPRSSTSTPSARRSSWPPPSMPTRPPSAARRSATARRSTSRSRRTTHGSRCGSSPSASRRPRPSRPTSTCSPMSDRRCCRTPGRSGSRRA